jgi:cell division protein FtsI/penicillin-binding protein 2
MKLSTSRWSSANRVAPSRRATSAATDHFHRTNYVTIAILLAFLAIAGRLYYWQIVRGDELSAAADAQYRRVVTITGKRGDIVSADHYTLATNKEVFRLFAQPHLLTQEPEVVAAQIVELLLADKPTDEEASEESEQQLAATLTQETVNMLKKPGARWVSLRQNLTPETKEKIEQLKITGLGFESYQRRTYPEASMAAHLLGFVGKDADGVDVGYFGLEGALERELRARSVQTTIQADALGLQLTGRGQDSPVVLDGRTVQTTIRRDIQFLVETQLLEGISRYGAKAGEIVVIEPSTGKILAYAAYPGYDPASFVAFDPQLYKNPGITKAYEPGSTFKVLTLAAGLDAGIITPETECSKCAGPWRYGKHTIKTWNDTYVPNTTMQEALINSDNTAMIFVAEQLGRERLADYLKSFGIAEELRVDLQEDAKTPFPSRIGPVELATISFGQGITTTTLQMARAVGAIANGGVMMRPQVISAVTDPATGETISIDPIKERRVISNQAAQQITQMMVNTVQYNEKRWTKNYKYSVAGKTGTSQIPIAGGYAQDRTIASFVAFAPASNPQFVMLIKFEEPTTSPWGDASAAPLWFKIADQLYLLLNLAPDR